MSLSDIVNRIKKETIGRTSGSLVLPQGYATGGVVGLPSTLQGLANNINNSGPNQNSISNAGASVAAGGGQGNPNQTITTPTPVINDTGGLAPTQGNINNGGNPSTQINPSNPTAGYAPGGLAGSYNTQQAGKPDLMGAATNNAVSYNFQDPNSVQNQTSVQNLYGRLQKQVAAPAAGVSINQGISNQDRANQVATNNILNGIATGNQSSQAQQAIAQSQAANAATANALAQSGRGGNTSQIMRQAQQGLVSAGNTSAAQAAQVGAAEQDKALAALQSGQNTLSGQDIGVATNQAGIDQQSALADQAATNQNQQFVQSQGLTDLSGLAGMSQQQVANAESGVAAGQAGAGINNNAISLNNNANIGVASIGVPNQLYNSVFGSDKNIKKNISTSFKSLHDRLSDESTKKNITTAYQASPAAQFGPGVALPQQNPQGTGTSISDAVSGVQSAIGAGQTGYKAAKNFGIIPGGTPEPTSNTDLFRAGMTQPGGENGVLVPSGFDSGAANSAVGSALADSALSSGAEDAAAGAAGDAIAEEGAADLADLAVFANKGGQMKSLHQRLVPGEATVSGDDIENDTVPAMLSPGEIVIPRTVVAESKTNPDAASSFVEETLSSKSPEKDSAQESNDHSVDGAMRDLLGKLGKSKQWEYKTPDLHDGGVAPPGRHVGPMWQDLEKSDLGKDYLKVLPDGKKVVDYGKMQPMVVSALSMLHRRLNDIEKQSKGKR